MNSLVVHWFALVAILTSTAAVFAQSGTPDRVWTQTGVVTYSPYSVPVIQLKDGRVLLPGGAVSESSQGRCQIFDPETCLWHETGSLRSPRRRHGGALLADGRVIVAGGIGFNGILGDSEFWDPATGMWTAGPPLATPRFGVRLVSLDDGRVLAMCDQAADFSDHLSCEIYDPATNAWRLTGPFNFSRTHYTVLKLRDGRVLVIGGADGVNPTGARPICEIYDPETETWSIGPPTYYPFVDGAAVQLEDGSVLASGGLFDGTTAEILDPSLTQWTRIPRMNIERAGHSLTQLADGRVFAVGGGIGQEIPKTTSFYDLQTMTWTDGPALHAPTADHGAINLGNDRILVVGGQSGGPPNVPAEVYGPPGPVIDSINVKRNASGNYVLTISASRLAPGVMFYADGIAPVQPAKLSANGQKVKVKGSFVDGRPLQNIFRSGQQVTITLRNRDGGFVVATYSRP